MQEEAPHGARGAHGGPPGNGAARRAEGAVAYRRRREDWLSGSGDAAVATAVAPPNGDLAARKAALELARATVVERDGMTGDHSDDVGLVCEAIADELAIGGQARANLVAAAQLHDIGKVAVPERILRKDGPLDQDEWAVVREHTDVGQRILGAVPELNEVARIVRHSHEHWDGSGYPDGLARDEIPLESRVILCADAFHAMRSDRPYRRGRAALRALAEMKANAGTQFDPDVVAALERVAKRMRLTRPVALDSGRQALRSRRLAALLLALALSGTAFAALRGGNEDKAGAASLGPTLPCVPEECRLFRMPVADAFSAGAATSRDSAPRGRRAWRRSARAHTATLARGFLLAPAGASPGSGGRGVGGIAPGGGGFVIAPDGGAAPGGTPGWAAPGAGPPADGSTQSPASGRGGGGTGNDGPNGNAYAYGHERRLQNPHPPKPPPGRMKPKKH